MAKIKPIFERVKKFIDGDRSYADNDDRLAATIWWNDLKNMGKTPTQLTADEFLHMLASGKLTDYGSIARARRICEGEPYNLRGHTYNERHKIAEPAVKEEVKQMQGNLSGELKFKS